MNVVFVGCTSSFGNSFAASNFKTQMLASGLSENGVSCTLHNGLAESQILRTDEDYYFEGVGRIITYAKSHPRIIDCFVNVPRLYRDLKSLYRSNEKNIIFLTGSFYHYYFLHYVIAKILGYNICVISQELQSSFKGVSLIRKISGFLYDKLFGYGVNSILPISEFLIKKNQHFGKPYLKTPVLADFSVEVNPDINKSGFAYCASIEYRRVIDIVIEGYKSYCKTVDNPQRLKLIISGNEKKIDDLKCRIKELSMDSNIEILSKLPRKELENIYSTSMALLLALDPDSIQDCARFSQKVAEYLASGTAIITTPVGEIPYYFTDRENAYLTDYSSDGFSKAFRYFHDNPSESIRIGINGYKLGCLEFDKSVFGKKLTDFLKKY